MKRFIIKSFLFLATVLGCVSGCTSQKIVTSPAGGAPANLASSAVRWDPLPPTPAVVKTAQRTTSLNAASSDRFAPRQQNYNSAVWKILGAFGLNSVSGHEADDSWLMTITKVGGHFGRNSLVKSAIMDVFPEIHDREASIMGAVIGSFMDKGPTYSSFSESVAREEIKRELNASDTGLAQAGEIVDFVYEVIKVRSR